MPDPKKEIETTGEAHLEQSVADRRDQARELANQTADEQREAAELDRELHEAQEKEDLAASEQTAATKEELNSEKAQ